MLQPFIINQFPKETSPVNLGAKDNSNKIVKAEGDKDKMSFKDTLSEKIEPKKDENPKEEVKLQGKEKKEIKESKKLNKKEKIETLENGELDIQDYSFEELYYLFANDQISLDELNAALENMSGAEILEGLKDILEILKMEIVDTGKANGNVDTINIKIPSEILKTIGELESNIETGNIDTGKADFKELMGDLLEQIKELISDNEKSGLNLNSDDALNKLSEISDLIKKINRPKISQNSRPEELSMKNTEEIKDLNSQIKKIASESENEKDLSKEFSKNDSPSSKSEVQPLKTDLQFTDLTSVENVEDKVQNLSLEEMVKNTPRISTNIMNQVVNVSKEMISYNDDLNEMVIKLKPEDLGNLTVKMSIKDGVILAEMNVENNVVKEVIESNIADLRNALKDKGYSEINIDVNINKEGSDNRGSQGNGNSKRRIFKNEELVDTGNIMDFLEEINFNYLA
jgi:flagellar hook-length control protein FliK